MAKQLDQAAVDAAKAEYDAIFQEGLTHKKAVKRTAEMLNLPRRRVYEWNRKRKKE